MRKSKQGQVTATEQSEIPQWVKDMHEHYLEKGYYRSEDVERALGSPNQGVEIPASLEMIPKHRRV